MSKAKILIADDDALIRKALGDRLKANGYSVILAQDGKNAIQLFQEENPDAVLLDLQMPVMDGLEALSIIHETDADIPVIILTAHGTMENAVQAMKQGALDFLPKPCDSDHLLVIVDKAVRQKSLVTENRYFKQELAAQHPFIIGTGSKMHMIMETAQKVATARTTVLIEGESGTGKQMLAWALHGMSDRSEKPFIHVNCTTLSEQLLESDLFGYEKGSFTGAQRMKKGRVELAHEGTLFLDEIGDLSPGLQSKFLRFIEEGAFERIGGLKTFYVDSRVIAATNKNLQIQVREGRFRADLFYRLNVVRLELPPLRERPEDIEPLVMYFMEKYNQAMQKRISVVTPDAMKQMRCYHWPGNVRELANVIERALVLAPGSEITAELMPPQLKDKPDADKAPAELNLESALKQFKKDHIHKILISVNKNQSRAAEILGVQRTYLCRLIKELGIDIKGESDIP
jgi:DNA-binding NtrC family response regulator